VWDLTKHLRPLPNVLASFVSLFATGSMAVSQAVVTMAGRYARVRKRNLLIMNLLANVFQTGLVRAGELFGKSAFQGHD
jgi:hypothetical protein